PPAPGTASNRTIASAVTTATNESALAKKQPASPKILKPTPAKTGPRTRESWNCVEFNATALATSSRPTRSKVIAWYEGPASEKHEPVMNESTRIIGTVTTCVTTSVPSVSAANPETTCV